MSVSLVTGKPGPIVTGNEKTTGDRNTSSVIVEGRSVDIEKIRDFSEFVPRGCRFVGSRKSDTGNGFSKLVVTYENEDDSYDDSKPTYVTFKITMEEVTKDLKMHPSVVSDRVTIERWLATDPQKRIDDNGDPQWVDDTGNAHKINDRTGAWKYCDAYMRGIEHYVVHYPVIEKISHYKTIPGCQTYEGKITGGSANFSDDIDHWSSPGISLKGYDKGGWLKSFDSYEQNGGKTFVRTEQWTYTPNGPNSPTGWIYDK